MTLLTADHVQIKPLNKAISANELAQMILAGFNRHYSLFRYSAQRAKALFEGRDWNGIQQLSKERIEYYDTRVKECVHQIEKHVLKQSSIQSPDQLSEAQSQLWQAAKLSYLSLLNDHNQPECAETFFNSVTSRVLHRDYFHNDFLFVRPAVATDYLDINNSSYRVYYPSHRHTIVPCIIQMLSDFGLACPFEDLPRDARIIAKRTVAFLKKQTSAHSGKHRIAADCQIHVLKNLFYRNKGAYLIGRLINQGIVYPFAIPLLHTQSSTLRLDALLLSSDEISTLFSFTRAYFLVDMEFPSAYVSFLGSLMPHKPKAELYTAIGLQKQGKTLFYRDFLYHLSHSTDKFDLADGIHGMVMSVFTLGSYPYVFKMTRDRIRKDGMTHERVKDRYLMVKMHDRVGRMADTWEYSQVALPIDRCTDKLLKELREEVPSLILEENGFIIIRSVYIERRMTPLNIFLLHANDKDINLAVKGYGDAIAELAAANIFAGDMLFKNFGLTRLGRVVFYDYDEIQAIQEMNFRKIPQAPNEEAELSGEPWYPIHKNDVFPEEFESFLLGNPRVRHAFLQHHAYLLDYQWWLSKKKTIALGKIEDIFPYPNNRRLHTLIE